MPVDLVERLAARLDLVVRQPLVIAPAWVSELRPMEAWEQKVWICPACVHASIVTPTRNGWWWCKYCWSNQRGANIKRVAMYSMPSSAVPQ